MMTSESTAKGHIKQEVSLTPHPSSGYGMKIAFFPLLHSIFKKKLS